MNLDKDKDMDLISGPYIYEGPDFATKRTYYNPVEIDPHKYSENYFITTYDFTADGHLHIFKFGRAGSQAHGYANPGRVGGEWKEHLALENPGNEALGSWSGRGS